MKSLHICRLLLCLAASSLCTALPAQTWPEAAPEAKAGTRWWWLGSAVDKANLQWMMTQYADHGIGAVEITPIYGVQGNERHNIGYLTDQWMEMLREVQAIGRQKGIEIDMATGTGWPFGGPWVPLEESACKVLFADTAFYGKGVTDLVLQVAEKDAPYSHLQKVMAYHAGEAYDLTEYVTDGKLTWSAEAMLKARLKAAPDKAQRKALRQRLKTLESARWDVVALFVRHGVMKVKRAAPGGEGWVVDHFDKDAVAHYLRHIEEAFSRTGTPYPHTFFNDSYEVSQATWTPTLLDEFARRRGYKLEDHLPALKAGDPQVVSDYRETLSDLLLEHFTEQWTAWAHRHGALTRNQAHGSPANLIDCYAAVDIPEIEGFGLSEFGIKGLRQDPGKTRKNDSDFTMLKYAPSAAHICGKAYTSSETFTWLTEHFRTSLSQLKPDIDLMFCAGVNHMYFHGTAYSPQDAPWPGWKFYASIDMSPTNSIWRDAPYFMQYVERCQRFLQWGLPDNDFLVYLPVRDMWHQHPEKLLMQFAIDEMEHLAPSFIQTILKIEQSGYDCDYISDRMLRDVTLTSDRRHLVTSGGTRYKALLIPSGTTLTPELKETLSRLSPLVIYGESASDMARHATPEALRSTYGLKAIRRQNDSGHHYFIANLSDHAVTGEVALAVPFADAAWFNPLNGEIYQATSHDGTVKIALQSGESMILQTYDQHSGTVASLPQAPMDKADDSQGKAEKPLDGAWTLHFTEEAPRVEQTFSLDKVQTWEGLDDDSVKVTMGTGIYTTTVTLTKQEAKRHWQIDLGDVRESARVYINGEGIGCAWSVPFVLDCKETLKAGRNTIRIEVTNLPANRIADMDRRGVQWRKMEDINVVDIHYKKTTYEDWAPMKSGLNSAVRLIER